MSVRPMPAEWSGCARSPADRFPPSMTRDPTAPQEPASDWTDAGGSAGGGLAPVGRPSLRGAEDRTLEEEPRVPVNVLIVDDRRENLVALEAVLEPLGERVIPAASADEALRCVLRDDFAVILLDVRMPGTSGVETARLIKARE